MILLDTHIWIWWVNQDAALPPALHDALSRSMPGELAVSAISCWEVAKLVEKGRLELAIPLEEWMPLALEGSAIEVQPITPSIAIASSRLPGVFHADPADRMIYATASVMGLPLLTGDSAIRAFEARSPQRRSCHVVWA